MGKEIENVKFIWMEYGEKMYQGAMNREETIKLMSDLGFQIVSQYSNIGSQGDLLFENQKTKIDKIQ